MSEPAPSDRRSTAAEQGLLLALIWSAGAFYLGDLGFYSDDWAVLSALHFARNQTAAGLFRRLAEVPNSAVRPLQIAWYVAFYKLAGANALYPHLGNTAAFSLAVLLFHAALRKIDRLRDLAFASCVIFVALPSFVTAKLWYANHQSSLSLALGFAAFDQAVRLRRHSGAGPMAARFAAIAFLAAACGLAYEPVTIVLVALPAFAWWFDASPTRRPDKALWLGTLAMAAGLAAGALYKLPYFTATGNALPGGAWLYQASYVAANAVVVNLGTLGAALPGTALRVAAGPFGQGEAIAAAAVAGIWLAIAARIGALGRAQRGVGPALLVWGGTLFVLGLVPFLSSFRIGFGAFGIDNRANVGVALGVTLAATGLYAVAADRWPQWARGGLGLYCACGIFLQVNIGLIWGEAWHLQQRLFRDIQGHVGPLRSGQTVLLYGLCSYYGPAPLFTSPWGFADRLQIARGVPDIGGDIVGAATRVTGAGVVAYEYDAPTLHRYPGLGIYQVPEHRLTPIGSPAAAQAFFAAHPPTKSQGCTFRDGRGVSLFR